MCDCITRDSRATYWYLPHPPCQDIMATDVFDKKNWKVLISRRFAFVNSKYPWCKAVMRGVWNMKISLTRQKRSILSVFGMLQVKSWGRGVHIPQVASPTLSYYTSHKHTWRPFQDSRFPDSRFLDFPAHAVFPLRSLDCTYVLITTRPHRPSSSLLRPNRISRPRFPPVKFSLEWVFGSYILEGQYISKTNKPQRNLKQRLPRVKPNAGEEETKWNQIRARPLYQSSPLPWLAVTSWADVALWNLGSLNKEDKLVNKSQPWVIRESDVLSVYIEFDKSLKIWMLMR